MSVAVGLIGGVVQAIGAMQSANAEAEMNNYKAEVARRNQQLANENAVRVQQTAQVEQESLEAENRARIGAVVSAQSASGLSLGGRSALLVRKSASRLARLDAKTLRQEGDLRSYNMRVDAANYASEAQLFDMAAKNAKKAGKLNAFTSLIGSAKGFAGSSSFGASGSIMT